MELGLAERLENRGGSYRRGSSYRRNGSYRRRYRRFGVQARSDKTEPDKTESDQNQQSAQTSGIEKSGFSAGSLPGWPSDRPAPHEVKFASSEAPKTDWSTVDGVSPELAAEFDDMGIKSVEQLESLSPADREKLESRLKSKGLSWNWDWLSSWKTGLAGVAGLGAAAAGAIGLGSKEAKEQQQPEVDKANLSGAEHEFGSKPVIGFAAGAGLSGDRSATGGGNANQGQSDQGQSGHEQSRDDRSLKFPEVAGPAVDWTTVDGIQPEMASELNDLGIQNINQLESLSADDRQKFEARMKSKGLTWDWGRLGGWKASLEPTSGASAGPNVTRGRRHEFTIHSCCDFN